MPGPASKAGSTPPLAGGESLLKRAVANGPNAHGIALGMGSLNRFVPEVERSETLDRRLRPLVTWSRPACSRASAA